MSVPTNKPTTRDYSLAALVSKAEGKNLNAPDPAYQFSNGKVKLSTDRTENGFYKR